MPSNRAHLVPPSVESADLPADDRLPAVIHDRRAGPKPQSAVKSLAAGPGPGSRPRSVLHVIVPEPEGSVGGADMHVRDLASAQRQQGTITPLVFETLSPTFARRVRETGVE